MTTGELRCVWSETSGLDHYRHAHAYDHLAGMEFMLPKINGDCLGGAVLQSGRRRYENLVNFYFCLLISLKLATRT